MAVARLSVKGGKVRLNQSDEAGRGGAPCNRGQPKSRVYLFYLSNLLIYWSIDLSILLIYWSIDLLIYLSINPSIYIDYYPPNCQTTTLPWVGVGRLESSEKWLFLGSMLVEEMALHDIACVYIYICIHVCININIYIYIYVHTHIYIYIAMYVCIYIYIFMYFHYYGCHRGFNRPGMI